MIDCNIKIKNRIKEIIKDSDLDINKKYMLVSYLASYNSDDPNTKVGACIVKDGKFISIGWNRMPCEGEFPWDREGEEEDTKYPYVIHAERDAIHRATVVGGGKDIEGSTIYVNLFPCNQCMQEIALYNIKELYYDCDKYHDTKGCKESRKIIRELNRCRDNGFKVKQVCVTCKDLEEYGCLIDDYYDRV